MKAPNILILLIVFFLGSYTKANDAVYLPVSPSNFEDIDLGSTGIYSGGIGVANFFYQQGILTVSLNNIRLPEGIWLIPRPYLAGEELNHLYFDIMPEMPERLTANHCISGNFKFSIPLSEGSYNVYFGEWFLDVIRDSKNIGFYQNDTETPFQLTIEEGMEITVNVEYPATETMFAEDVEWLYSVDGNEYEPSTYICRFIGTEIIDGKTYHPYYYCQGDVWVEENKQLMAYMRNDGSNVYTLPADVTLPSYLWLKGTDREINPKDLIDGEALVYSFVPPMAPEKIMVSNVIDNTFEAIEALTYDWRHDGSIIFNDDIVWTPYRGSIGRGCNLLPYPIYNYLDQDGGKVYPVTCDMIRKISNWQGSVGVISDSLQEGEVRYYDLQGLPVSNPAPGQLIIEQTPSGTRKLIH